ncbi:MAG TPA: hypothetical protein VI386_27995 [Candidatus Sulfotelmatobacter sp.]
MLKTLLHVIPRERACSEKAETGRAVAPFAPAAAGKERGASTHAALIVLLLTSFAAAQSLTGTVKNSTTGKPSAGDEIVMFKLGRMMEESGRTKTDAAGRFSFKLDDSKGPHLIRAIHQEVAYHRMAPPGTASVAIEVYDVAKKVKGIKAFADIMRIEAAKGQIAITREFGVQNISSPPRTQVNERNLEFYVPDNAKVIGASATAAPENGNPMRIAPIRESGKGRYSFAFPLRPGFTRFQVTYRLPYSGSADLDPKSLYPLEHFMVMMPKALRFRAAASSTRFKGIRLPNQPDTSVQVASDTTDGENLAFHVSGEGTFTPGPQRSTQNSGEREQSSAGAAGAQSENRAGGGLGPPIDAPDPLQKYRWWILGCSAAVLLIAGVRVAYRQQSATRAYGRAKETSPRLLAPQEDGDHEPAGAGILDATRAPVAARSPFKLMQGIKEELFQLETERKKRQISRSEYEKVKAALDQTLVRALARSTRA